MRKNRVKSFFKYVIPLLGVFLIFSNCEKEDVNIPTEAFQEKRIKRISLKDLESKLNKSRDYEKLNKLFDVTKKEKIQSSQRLEASDNAWLATDEIVMITKENATFYTFTIETDASGDQFYNLVVAVDEMNNIVSMRILEYTPSVSWLNDKSQPFSGTM